MMRFAASLACLSIAIRCFANINLELGHLSWAWIILGIGWIYFTLRIAMRGTES